MMVTSFVSYVLRTNLSIVGETMMSDLKLDHVQFGLVLSGFAWGYALFQFPGGIFGDILGSRKSMMLIAILWFVLTVLTGLTPGRGMASVVVILGSLILIRFLVGASHAPIFPVVGGTIGNWFPVSSWALPNGLISAALNLGAAAAAPIILSLMMWGWRGSFFLTAPLGLFASWIWWKYIRDYPADDPRVSKSELDLIDSDRPPPNRMEKGAWKIVLRNREILLLTASYFCMNYIFYLIFNWFFIYLVDVRKVPVQEAGYLTASQYVIGSLGAIFGGYFGDHFAKRLGPRWGYRMLPVPALLLSTICIIAGAYVENSYLAVLFFALCSGLTQITDPVYWGAIVSVAGRHAAAAGGVLNTGGNVVGGIGAVLVPLIAKHFGWPAAIASGSIFTIVGALLWLLVRSDRMIETK